MRCDWDTNQRMQYLSVDFRNDISAYMNGLQNSLLDFLEGIYAYGSLAWGCHNLQTSDIDVIVVLAGSLDAVNLRKLQQVHRRTTIPIDATFVTRDQLSISFIPTEVEFVIKPMSDEIIRYPQRNWDFVAQSQDVYENGIRLYGPEIENLFKPVPWILLKEYCEWLLPHVVPRFKNPVLMLSRLAYTHKHRRMCSKAKAGNWALEAMPSQFHHLIGAGLREYSGDTDVGMVNSEDVLDFEIYIRNYIANLT